MKKNSIKLLLILLICSSISIPTLSAFVKNVEKTGTIQTKELSTAFLSNSDLLIKIQALDSSITEVDKELIILVHLLNLVFQYIYGATIVKYIITQ